VESVEGRQYAVVGAFTADGPLSDLRDSVLLTGVAPDVPLRRITVEARTADLVLPLATLLRDLVGPEGEGGVGIDISADLGQAQQAVRGELAGYSQAIVLQALGAGLLLMAGAVLTGVNARRRDFGRRRALGAARGQLVLVVVAQALWAAVPGVLLGAVVGSILTARLAGSGPGWQYPLAVAVLTALGAALAAVAPSVIASFGDPVVPLRVP